MPSILEVLAPPPLDAETIDYYETQPSDFLLELRRAFELDELKGAPDAKAFCRQRIELIDRVLAGRDAKGSGR